MTSRMVNERERETESMSTENRINLQKETAEYVGGGRAETALCLDLLPLPDSEMKLADRGAERRDILSGKPHQAVGKRNAPHYWGGVQ